MSDPTKEALDALQKLVQEGQQKQDEGVKKIVDAITEGQAKAMQANQLMVTVLTGIDQKMGTLSMPAAAPPAPPAIPEKAPDKDVTTLVTIPDVARQSADKAEGMLADTGLENIEVKDSKSASVEPGHAVRTNPKAGTRVTPSEKVTVYVVPKKEPSPKEAHGEHHKKGSSEEGPIDKLTKWLFGDSNDKKEKGH
jgi:hypothetical protein